MDFKAQNFPLTLTRKAPYVSNAEFREHIRGVLSKTSNIDEENIIRWTSPKYAEIWEQSRTHSTYNKTKSYEDIEFIGDKLANSIVALYISETYKEVINTEWLTKLQNNLHSSTSFMQIGYFLNLYKYVLISQEAWDAHILKPDNYKHLGEIAVWENPNWKKLLTDMFEAFIGALFKIVKDDQGYAGVAFEIIYKVISAYLPRVKIILKIDLLVDPVTLLKESMELKRKELGLLTKDENPIYNFKKHFIQNSREIPHPDGTHHVEFKYDFTLPDPRDRNKSARAKNSFVTVVHGEWFVDDTHAKNDTAKKGLKVWEKDGNKIVEKPNYDQKSVWKPKRV